MQAPTPVAALIHAATMVTAGVFSSCSISLHHFWRPFWCRQPCRKAQLLGDNKLLFRKSAQESDFSQESLDMLSSKGSSTLLQAKGKAAEAIHSLSYIKQQLQSGSKQALLHIQAACSQQASFSSESCRCCCRPRERPLRLFETAMQKVTAASQDNKPSVFDRLTSQAAQGNAAATATASTVVKSLQRSAAAAKRQGDKHGMSD